MNDFLTWEVIGSFAGAAALVGVLTQFTKKLPGLIKMPTQLWTYVLSLAVLLLSTAALRGFGVAWTVWALIPINAVVVSLASNGGYEAAVRLLNGKPE
jgi:hypothetical protein